MEYKSLEHHIRNIMENKNLEELYGIDKLSRGSQFMGVRSVTPHISPEHHTQSAETVANQRKNAKQRTSLTLHGKVQEEDSGTAERVKIKNVGRPDDANPTSSKETLSKTSEIKHKIIDEEDCDCEKTKGKKTEVEINPELSNLPPDDYSEEKNSKKEKKEKKMSEETNPLIAAFLELQSKTTSNIFEEAKKLSDKQKKIAALAGDKGKIDAHDLAALRAGKHKVSEEVEDIEEGMKISSGGYGKVHVTKGGKIVKTFKDPRDARMFVSSEGKKAEEKKNVKESEEIDEISKDLKSKYIEKAMAHAAASKEKGYTKGWKPKKGPKAEKARETMNKRTAGVAKAFGEGIAVEDIVTYGLEEGFTEDLIFDYIVENYELDEISKEKLGSYIRGAAHSVSLMAAKRAGKVRAGEMGHGSPEYQKSFEKQNKRHRGIAKATDKLVGEGMVSAKESVEFSSEELAHFDSVLEGLGMSKDATQKGAFKKTGTNPNGDSKRSTLPDRDMTD